MREFVSVFGLLAVLFLSSEILNAQPLKENSGNDFAQPERVAVSANGRVVAFVRGDKLWAQRLNSDGTPSGQPILVSNGMARDVGFQREFDALSPDGTRLVFRTGRGSVANQGELRVAYLNGAAASRVSVKPLLKGEFASRLQTFVHFAGGGAAWSSDNRRIAFPALDKTQDKQLQIYVVDIESEEFKRWTDDPTWKFSCAWSLDGKSIAVGTGDYAAQKATIQIINSPGVFRELVSVKGRWLTDLLWSSDGASLVAARDAGSPLMIKFAPDGTARIEDVSLPRLRFVAFTPDGNALLARQRDGISSRLVMVNRNDGRVSEITPADKLYSPIGITGTPKISTLFFTTESGALPRQVQAATLSPNGGKLIKQKIIARSSGSIAGGVPYNFSVFRWSSRDGDALEAKLYLPRRAAKAGSPPPLVVVPYGGYSNRFDDPGYFMMQNFLELMRRGWAVVFPNTRCASSVDTCVGHYGDYQLEDTELLLEALGARKLADPQRVAVIGHSHGGSLAYYYATHSARFCAVVAVNGRADWEMQAKVDSYLVQQMGGLPDKVPELYTRFSPLRNTKSVTTPLLAIAGKLDGHILPANASAITSDLQSLGKKSELLMFEDEDHWIVKPENIQRYSDTIITFLNGACRSDSN